MAAQHSSNAAEQASLATKISNTEAGITHIAPGLWRIAVPSRTLPPFDHSNSYLLASRGVGVLVDMGGDSPAALASIDAALQQAEVTLFKALLLTHSHSDHIAGVGALVAHYDLPLYLHPLEWPRLEQHLQTSGTSPAITMLRDGHKLTVGDQLIEVLHTPGHSAGHLSFYLPELRTLLAGDMLASHGSTWVGLPEGDIAQYLQSLTRLEQQAAELIAPGHGDPIHNPRERLQQVRAHRLAREQQLLDILAEQQSDLATLCQRIYPELPNAKVQDLAQRSLLAQLQKLMAEMKVMHLGNDEQGPYALRR